MYASGSSVHAVTMGRSSISQSFAATLSIAAGILHLSRLYEDCRLLDLSAHPQAVS